MKRTLLAFGHEEKTSKHILIIGGGNIGLNLAKMAETNLEGTEFVADVDQVISDFIAAVEGLSLIHI